MPASPKTHTVPIIWYISSDYFAALLSSIIFHFSRRILLSEAIFIHGRLFLTNRFWLGTITIPAGLAHCCSPWWAPTGPHCTKNPG